MAYQPKSYRKFVATAATATLVASAVAPFASAASFNDVNSRYAEAVDFVTSKGVQGLTDSKFGTADNIKRVDAAVMLVKVLGLDVDAAPASGFTDVPSRAVKEVNALKAAGITSGKSETKFNSDAQITRGELAIWIKRAFDLKGEAHNTFSDVSGIYTNAVTALVVNKVTLGKTETKFGTQDNATRGEYALFLKRAYDASNVEDTDAVVKGIKAINATTVEITYGEKVTVENVAAAKYTIDGLEVKTAAIKQTDDKTVVLTTSTQTGDKEYTVKNGEETLGKFKGVSAVIPTAIKVTTPSIQGTIGKEVTVKAQVTVPEGQSKAGIPVTFNIVNDNANLNQKVEVVAYTNDEGVASYSYTRYYKANDNVTAYATEKSSVFASSKVYWAEGLTITEVTEGNALANGAKKVYKIKTDAYATETNGTTSTTDDYNYVNVAFAENVDVSPDKLVRGASVIDTGVATNASYPSQVTTGGVNEVRVKVDAKGEATFTVTGSNSAVTPIVFVDANKNGKFAATELQATAPTVKFELSHTLGLAVKAEGVQNAAATNAKGTGEGGRTYTVTVTDKDGKVAPAGTKAYVTFAEGSYSTDKAAYIKTASGLVAVNKNTRYEITVTGTKGEATFRLVGQRDAFAAPTVYLENGKETGLDKADLQVVGETTYFVDSVVTNATLTVENAAGKEVTTLLTSQTAYFNYQSVDQNEFPYYVGTGSYEVSYQVTAHFADVVANGTTVKAGTTETIKVNAVNGKAQLAVVSTNVTSNVSVQASASQVSLPNKGATINFTNSLELPATYTGYVTNLDESNEKVKFDQYNAVSYANGTFYNVANQSISKEQFVAALKSVVAGKKAQVTAQKQADGSYKFNINSLTVDKSEAELLVEAQAKLAAAKTEAASLVQAEYTAESWTAYTTAKTAADLLPEGTKTEVDAKTAAIKAAIGQLVTKSSVDAAEKAANEKLAKAKDAAKAKTEADYKASTWKALTAALALDEVSVNQKIAKATAIDNAVAALVAKALPVAKATITDTNANVGELTLTFSEATPANTLVLNTIVDAKSSVTSETATVAVSSTPDNKLVLTVKDATPAAVDLTTNKAGVYTFNATITVTGVNAGEFKVQDVVVTVKYDTTTTAWVAEVANK